ARLGAADRGASRAADDSAGACQLLRRLVDGSRERSERGQEAERGGAGAELGSGAGRAGGDVLDVVEERLPERLRAAVRGAEGVSLRVGEAGLDAGRLAAAGRDPELLPLLDRAADPEARVGVDAVGERLDGEGAAGDVDPLVDAGEAAAAGEGAEVERPQRVVNPVLSVHRDAARPSR